MPRGSRSPLLALGLLVGALAVPAALPAVARTSADLPAPGGISSSAPRGPAPSLGPAPEGRRDVGPVGGAPTAAEARAVYRTVRGDLGVPAGWSGSVKKCRVGAESSRSREATLETVNALRGLAGIRPVRLERSLSHRALAAALMMKAEGALSHSPGPGWKCYSKAGAAGAGASNLFLGVSGAAAMVGYVNDGGVDSLGHRRWLLNPGAATFGTGSTGTSNALYVFGRGRQVPTGTAIAWPPAGFVPQPWIFEDWSLELVGDVDADGARVEVSLDGEDIDVSGVRELEAGYGPGGGVTWHVDLPAALPSGSHEVRVDVTGLRLGGQATPISWTTTVVDVG